MTRNILTSSRQDSLKVAATTARLLLGIFFVLSGIANYLHFSESGGLLETLTTQKLKLWGLGFEGIGPLPGLLSLPYAYLLPAVEIVVGVLFLINRQVKWAGVIMLLMLTSFILAFGLFPKAGLFPSNESTWDKNVFIMLSVWLVIAYADARSLE